MVIRKSQGKTAGKTNIGLVILNLYTYALIYVFLHLNMYLLLNLLVCALNLFTTATCYFFPSGNTARSPWEPRPGGGREGGGLVAFPLLK